ncbi:lipase/acyltransferase domain-containing protein [Crocosphaera sp. XPORK-15E]|uniref:lipase/acyltransferase domain-containing protein n=1 Tax=Crocosphaera sp. XPORK-15E TaxID=3110247 RepID=UPI002B2136C1|nr:hypothetical protein [Crocosphaera sp. XPORK-15E]MEA5534564.1 hypothetical protein [Crocosphaera sp. XPORK-15E]
MGSSLTIRNDPPQPWDKEIWGENLGININTISNNPSLLTIQDNKQVEAVKVIKRFKYIPKDLGNVYGSLCDFLVQPISEGGLGLQSDVNFFPFAYDWRKDNEESAKKLADFIKNKDQNGNSRFRFIVHSMGGIVTRLMLLDNPKIAERTELLFQIASPLLGSAKAYCTLKKRPEFNPIFDLICQTLGNWDKVAQFRTSIMGFPSVYQLLPPPEIKSLCDRQGNLYSALDDSVWQKHFREYVQQARDVHQRLKQSQELNTRIRTRCIGSGRYPTPKRYVIDPEQDFNLIMRLRRVPLSADGDDTVTFSSAIAYSVYEPENLIDTEPCKHMTICHNQEVYNMLKMEWNEDE